LKSINKDKNSGIFGGFDDILKLPVKMNTGKEFPSACIRFPSSPSLVCLAL
jgi:hypothetical protein